VGSTGGNQTKRRNRTIQSLGSTRGAQLYLLTSLKRRAKKMKRERGGGRGGLWPFLLPDVR